MLKPAEAEAEAAAAKKAEEEAQKAEEALLRNLPSRPLKRPNSLKSLIMLADALEHLVSGIVDNPDDVEVTTRSMRRGQLLEVASIPTTWAASSDEMAARLAHFAQSCRPFYRGPVRVDVIDTDRSNDS